jgi:hydroxyacylglutathione hydrolase
MAAREFSTLGYERRHNPRLQLNRDDFIRYKTSEHHYKPPYFQKMERWNQYGAETLHQLPRPRPMTADQFAQAQQDGMVVLDVRAPEAIAGALIPGSIAIPLEMTPSFAGWYVPYDRPIGLVMADAATVEQAVRYLIRLGYDHIIGYLDDGLHAWATSGRHYHTIPAIHADTLKSRIENQTDYVLLDVRSRDEYQSGHLPGTHHLYVGEVEQRREEIPSARPVTTFCGSGQRAIIAASLLKKHGMDEVEVCLGSMAACRAIGCPLA